MTQRVCREGSFDLCLRPATHVLFDFDPMAGTHATATDVCASCAVETRDWTGNRATFVRSPFIVRACSECGTDTRDEGEPTCGACMAMLERSWDAAEEFRSEAL